MTEAERQRRRRERLARRLPTRRPWDDAPSDNRRETETIDAIENWLEYGDEEAVIKWLASLLVSRGDDVDVVLDKLRKAIEDEDP